jgi:hypothetical protein
MGVKRVEEKMVVRRRAKCTLPSEKRLKNDPHVKSVVVFVPSSVRK